MYGDGAATDFALLPDGVRRRVARLAIRPSPRLIYRTVELGPRTDQAKVDQWNTVVGLQGTVKGWDYQLAANYTTNQQIDSYVSGWVYASKFGELLRSGVVNPFAANTPRCWT